MVGNLTEGEGERPVSEQAPAVVGIAALAVDCADPPGLAGWWSRLLGGEVEGNEFCLRPRS